MCSRLPRLATEGLCTHPRIAGADREATQNFRYPGCLSPTKEIQPEKKPEF